MSKSLLLFLGFHVGSIEVFKEESEHPIKAFLESLREIFQHFSHWECLWPVPSQCQVPLGSWDSKESAPWEKFLVQRVAVHSTALFHGKSWIYPSHPSSSRDLPSPPSSISIQDSPLAFPGISLGICPSEGEIPVCSSQSHGIPIPGVPYPWNVQGQVGATWDIGMG